MGLVIRSRAPLRVSFAGGGTDVLPYLEQHGGAVLSATIDKYAYASLIPREDHQTTIESLDYNIIAKYHRQGELPSDNRLDLVKATLQHLQIGPGFELLVHSDATPGTGLGSSSTMIVTLVGLFNHWLQRSLSRREIAQLAYEIERVDLSMSGGMQDQFAATFGGLNFIEFNKDSVIVSPLRIPRSTINELQYRLLLCYTGRTRQSSDILRRQIRSVIAHDERVLAALDATKNMALAMKNALQQDRLDDLGHLLHQAWILKQQFDSQISSSEIDEIYAAARRKGAIGGKILGAGGGGYLLLYCDATKKHLVAEAVEQMGCELVQFGFDRFGLQTWQTSRQSPQQKGQL